MSEKFYDEEVAPVLLDLAKKCQEHSVPFIAAVEYEPGQVGKTRVLPKEGASLGMVMTQMCAMGSPNLNLDSVVLGILRYCKEKEIDTSQSVIYHLPHVE